MFMKKLTLTFLILFLIAGCSNHDRIVIDNGVDSMVVNVEIADTAKERAQGLMFRENLGESEGMLFVFEGENYHSFWMKNTLIPLEMIFINENLEIVDIKHAVPCKIDPCANYRPAEPAGYVLEVNEGFSAENGISIGDRVLMD
jgi:uncharacterized protein